MHSAAGRQENTAAPSLREQRGIQEWSTLSRRHRGTHLGAVPRPRHEALSRRRTRPLRIVGRRRCARQQSHENRGNIDHSIAAQTKSRLTDTQARFRGRSERPRLNLSRAESLPPTTNPKFENNPSEARRWRPPLAFCAQSIEIT